MSVNQVSGAGDDSAAATGMQENVVQLSLGAALKSTRDPVSEDDDEADVRSIASEGGFIGAAGRLSEHSEARPRKDQAEDLRQEADHERAHPAVAESEALLTEIAQLQVELQYQRARAETAERRLMGAAIDRQEREAALAAVLLRDGRDRATLLAELQAAQEARLAEQQTGQAALAEARRQIGTFEAETAERNASIVEARLAAEEQVEVLRGDVTIALRLQLQREVDLKDLRRRYAELLAEKGQQDALLRTLMQWLKFTAQDFQDGKTLPDRTTMEGKVTWKSEP